jgi:hypothetical protein
MSEESIQRWWISTESGAQGPFTQSEIFEAARTGRIQTGTLLREEISEQWLAASISFPAAFGPVVVTETETWTSTPRADLAQPENVGLAVFLTIITLGIWFVVWLYPRLTWYAQQSGRPMGSRVTYYWLLIGFAVASIFIGLFTFLLWFPLFIAAIVFGSLLTYDLVKDQEVIVTSRGALIGLAATPTTLVTLYAVGNGLGITILLLPATLVLLIVFYYLFFKNHNAAIAALTQ